ncbi:MAG: GCN5-related N-acetyltransferase [Herbinix sp.]|jgi:GNAT superfamily N-acetyltransferase|nr:GCN5-related N-acetyltransferase [Herbinix sp.]
MIDIISVKSLEDIQGLRNTYKNELPYAQDLNMEENIWISNYFCIKYSTITVGYVCIDANKTLWEFYLEKSAMKFSQEIFQFLIEMNYITAAESKTYDHLLMSLCLDFHKEAEGSAYLFRDSMDVIPYMKEYENITMRLASQEDFTPLSNINKIAEDVEFFHDLREDIENKEVFVFLSNNQLLGAGTSKLIWKNNNHRDIGMVVAEEHRCKGVGTYIIIKLKEYCYANNYIPVAGCWYYNYSSKKTLEKAGFISKHRVIRYQF